VAGAEGEGLAQVEVEGLDALGQGEALVGLQAQVLRRAVAELLALDGLERLGGAPFEALQPGRGTAPRQGEVQADQGGQAEAGAATADA